MNGHDGGDTRRGDRWWAVGLVYAVITVGMAYPLSVQLHSHLLNYDSDAKLIQWILGWDIYAISSSTVRITWVFCLT